MYWGTNRILTVKDCYKQIWSQNQKIHFWPWRLIICFNYWLTWSLLTQDNLNRKGFYMVNRCTLCRKNEETVNHLLLHCSVAIDIWSMLYRFFELSLVMPQNLRRAQLSWSLWNVDKAIMKIWLMILQLFSGAHGQRNRRCSDGCSTPSRYLKANCLINLFCWTELSPVISNDIFSRLSVPLL